MIHCKTKSACFPAHAGYQVGFIGNNVKCLLLRYQRDKTRTDVTLMPLACPVMPNWKPPGADAPQGFEDMVISPDGDIETREVILPMSGKSSCFLRLRVVLP